MSDRRHEIEVDIEASPSAVWETLSTAPGIMSWFAPEVRVEPGEGGSVFASWGPGMEGSERITAWEPDRHLQLTRERSDGRQASVLDYFIEGVNGATSLRLIHSGFGDAESFDEEFESTGGAWPVFMKMLKNSAERGGAACRNISLLRTLGCARADAWATLQRGIQYELRGVARHFDSMGYACWEFPSRNHAMLAVFCETCSGQTMLTVTWLLYDAKAEEVEELRARWTKLLDRVFA
jgi:uncharacterized protein YndB with AHSA1/START domain